MRAEVRPGLNGGIDLSPSKSVCLQASKRKQMGTEAGRLGDVVVRIYGLSFLFASISQWNRISVESRNSTGGIGSLKREKKCFSYLEHIG